LTDYFEILKADPHVKDITGASPIDYVTKRNLFFCNSIIEICLRNQEKRNRGSSNASVASSFNGSELNLTPAPPQVPKNPVYTRSFHNSLNGRPPRPFNSTSGSFNMQNSLNDSQDLIKTAPASLNNISDISNGEGSTTGGDQGMMNMLIQPSPPPVMKPPNYRWNSSDRIQSGSLRLSRASTRTSLASDDLEKYLPNAAFDGLNSTLINEHNTINSNKNSLHQHQQQQQQNLNNIFNSGNNKPNPQPRISSSNSANNLRLNSGVTRHETSMSTASYDLNISSSSSQVPPPVKVSQIYQKNQIIEKSLRSYNSSFTFAKMRLYVFCHFSLFDSRIKLIFRLINVKS
jgi:hypothetical protein